MKYFFIYLWASMSMFLLLAACNDPAAIDTDLIDQDRADVVFKNDFSLTASTIEEDSVQTYNVGNQLNSYPCGIFVDPVFGETEASIYGQVRLVSVPDYDDVTFDSIVLSLAYSNPGLYGDSTEQVSLDVYRILEDIDGETDYYSDAEFDTEITPLGTFEYFPRPNDSVDINLYTTDSVRLTTVAPHIRTKLDPAFGQEVINFDSTTYSTNANFLEALKGLYLKPEGSTEGISAFDLRSNFSRLSIYYTTDEGTPLEYSYFFTDLSAKIVNYKHDYSNSIVEPFLINSVNNEDLIFIQGMSGVNTKITIDDIDDLGDVIINKAELELYVAEIPTDNAELYAPISQIIVAEKDEDDSFIFIDDVNNAIIRADIGAFGGALEEDTDNNVMKYTVNITTHLQDIISGVSNNEIFIRSFPKASNLSRSVLYGVTDSTYPIKLKVTYTIY